MYDFTKKDLALNQSNSYTLAKTLSMFEWEGLPETIPQKELEKLLQVHGYAFIIKHNESLYAVVGGLGGELDVYGNPTKIVVANPALKLTKTFDIKTEGVLIYSDDFMLGLNPLITKYNTLLVENDLSMLLNSYATRMQLMISASDDKTKTSVDAYLKKLISGELAVIGENALFDGIKHHTRSGQNNDIKNLIEFHQYIRASLFNELGLDASFNMKRERLNTAEVGQNSDALYPFIDSMMKCRLEAIAALESFYGLTLKVGYGSIWNVKNKKLVDGIVNDEGVSNEESEQKPVNLGSDKDDSEPNISEEEREERNEIEPVEEPVEEPVIEPVLENEGEEDETN